MYYKSQVKKDYVYDIIKHYGYKIFTPYKGNGLLLRILREIWFRANLPGKSLWFRYAKPKTEYKAIILFDPLIQRDYIEWLHCKSSHCRIILSNENHADKTISHHTVTTIVEFVFNLPSKFKINKSKKKIISKDAFSDIIPKEIVGASKKDFGVPVGKWLESGLKAEFVTYFEEGFLENQGLFTGQYIRDTWVEHLNEKK